MGAKDEEQHFESSLQRALHFLLSSLISSFLPFPSLQSFIICMWLASFTLLSSDPVPPVSNLPTHRFLWYWPIAGTALRFFFFFFWFNITKRYFRTCFLSFFLDKECGKKQKFKVLSYQRRWWTQESVRKRLLALSRRLKLENTLLLKTSLALSCMFVIAHFLYLSLIPICVKLSTGKEERTLDQLIKQEKNITTTKPTQTFKGF